VTPTQDPRLRVRHTRRPSRTAAGATVALVLVLSSLLSACWVNQNDIALVDKVNPGAPVAAGAVTRDIAYGPDAAQKLDVYLPFGPQQGTIVYFHSGGWTGGTKANVPALILQELNRGWAVVSVDHRLAGTSGVRAPQILADVDRSIRYVKANAQRLGVDTSTIVASGWSAGAHLALMAAIAPGFQVAPDLPAELAGVAPNVDAVVSIAGTSDLTTWAQANSVGRTSVDAFVGCPTGGTPPVPPCQPLSPDLYNPSFRALFAAWLGIRIPPAYIVNAVDDTLVPIDSQGTTLYERWSGATGDSTTYFDVPPAGGHDSSLQANKTIFDSWLGRVKARSF
jgi:acetyl esterase/lipase